MKIFNVSAGLFLLLFSVIHAVDINQQTELSSKELTPTFFIFAHGLGPKTNQAQDLASIMPGTVLNVHFDDFVNNNGDFNRQKVTLGQEPDIQAVKKVYDDTIKDFPDASIVLVGISRGGAVMLNFAARHQPTQVKAIVAEAAFDHVNYIINHIRTQYIRFMPLLLAKKCFQYIFPNIQFEGIFPRESIKHVSKDIPIFLIQSKEDKVVPRISALTLCASAAAAGHYHVYALELEKGAHGKYMHGPEADRYRNTVHAFFKSYDLPYIKEYADQGQKDF